MLKIENKRLTFDYDSSIFNFYQLFQELADPDNKGLNNLHNYIGKEFIPTSAISVDNDQSQDIYKVLYAIDKGYNLGLDAPERGQFLTLFDNFAHHIAKSIFKEDLVYQNRPTLRVSFPGNKAVGDWHRDREYNHPLEEVNIWVPITIASNTNTIWIESSFDKEDYSPVNIDFGKFLIFDSGLKHGNVVNNENQTRISFDFRVIPKSIYKTSDEGSSSYSQGINLKLGEYYSVTSI
jgi:hypothetical protein|tara:strand:+ start:212 stop:919 length:708 start_codon:yes stop_codon:yes gene_type:complete